MIDRDREVNIRRACARLRSARTRADLLEILYREVSGYSLFDLRPLPAGYRQRLYPRVMEQLFDTHHILISTARRAAPGLLRDGRGDVSCA